MRRNIHFKHANVDLTLSVVALVTSRRQSLLAIINKHGVASDEYRNGDISAANSSESELQSIVA